MTLTCMRTGCSATEQLAIPLIHCWALGMPRSRRYRATMTLPLWTCARCREATSIEHLITDQGWDRILGYFAARRLLPPDRASAELEWAHGVRAQELVARVEGGRPTANRGALH